MDKLLSINQNKGSTKVQTKPKIKKTVKVVYISNPIKVKTSASEFRALVQELTGCQDGVIRRSDEEICLARDCPRTAEMPKVEDSSTAIDHSTCNGSNHISYADFDVLSIPPQVMHHDSNLWS